MSNKVEADENALSRQLAVYGHEAQGKLMAMRVLLVGLSGVGVEVAKNLVLAGPKAVTLLDNRPVDQAELRRNFFLRPAHIGKATVAQATLPELQQLNPAVQLSVVEAFRPEDARHFSVVVLVDQYQREFAVQTSKACHDAGVGFIFAGALGLYGFTFVDFGEEHRVVDQTGEEMKVVHIAGITQEEQSVVCLHDDAKHGFEDGDLVQFREVQGMVELNGQTFPVKVISSKTFSIGDTRAYSAYAHGGQGLQQRKVLVRRGFALERSLRCPYAPGSREMPIASWEKFGRPEQLHVVLNAVLEFVSRKGSLPGLLSQQDADELGRITAELLGRQMEIEGESFKVEKVEEQLWRNVALYARCQLSPVSSFWGGLVTQEIVKFTGKYDPLGQWLHHEFFEVVGDAQGLGAEGLGEPRCEMEAVFGREVVEKIERSRSFLVGAGALGCEVIKMFALMGFGVRGGLVTVTDDDNIEISNLNRQFLFRREHVGKNKSETACHVGRGMNPACPFDPRKVRVSPDNDHVFDDAFWQGLDFVVNAVDNVKARQFIDDQCVWFEKPLFESGTLGTKCHSQVIIPHQTISYSDVIDPPEKEIPLCTLKNFPYQIDHTIQWARDYFEGAFAEASRNLTAFVEEGPDFLTNLAKELRANSSILLDKLRVIAKLNALRLTGSYRDCLQLGLEAFQDVLHDQIQNLLHAYPPNAISNETQKPFWSGLKRTPTPISFSVADPLHVQTVQAAANIFAGILGLPMERDVGQVTAMLAQLPVPQYVPRHVKIETGEKKEAPEERPQESLAQEEQSVAQLLDELRRAPRHEGRRPQVMEFEKDDPTNFHIELVGGVANLRARNYRIEEVSNFQVKLIAGKIIPAIATTTALVVGLVGLEILKFLKFGRQAAFKNCTVNLALPLWIFNDPTPAILFEDKEYDPIMLGPLKVVPRSSPSTQSSPSGRSSM